MPATLTVTSPMVSVCPSDTRVTVPEISAADAVVASSARMRARSMW